MKPQCANLKSRLPKLKLRGQLLIATGILVLLPLLLTGYLVNLRVNRSMDQQAVLHNTHFAALVNSEVQRFLQENQDIVATAASLADLSDTTVRSLFLARMYKLGYWQNVYYADYDSGRILDVYPRQDVPADFDARSRSWFRLAVSCPGVYVTDTYQDFLTGKMVITFSQAIRGQTGQITGIIGADLDLDVLAQTITQRLQPANGLQLWLADSQGNLLVKPSTQLALTTSALSPAFFDQVKVGHIITQETIPNLQWQVLIAQDASVALADARRLSLEIMGLTFLFLVLAILAVLMYVNRLTAPIELLLHRIKAIEQGASLWNLPVLVSRFDEIDQVALAFDRVTEELQGLLRDVITTLTATLDARDPYTKNHSDRVSRYAYLLATYLGWPALEAENVLRAGLLHDVGKIGVPESILNKPGPLTAEEYAIMQTHARASYEILQGIPYYLKLGIVEVVLEHHERWDGKGYPLGLAGEKILPGARVLAIADAFDAMTSDRAYRKALTLEQALAELKRCAGQQFDPDMVAVFTAIPHETLLNQMHATRAAQMQRVALTAV